MNSTVENVFETKLVAAFLFYKIDMENRKEVPVVVSQLVGTMIWLN